MKKKNVDNQKQSVKEIKKYEKDFSANRYNGNCMSDYVIEQGSIPVMISAPHSVNHFREGKVKYADMLTGGIARYLQSETTCHSIVLGRTTEHDPNYDAPFDSEYKKVLKEHIAKHDIKCLIDLHGSSSDKSYAVEMGTIDENDSSLHRYKFISKLIEYSLDVQFKDIAEGEKKSILKNEIFKASHDNTITHYISREMGIACIQLEINREFRNLEDENRLIKLVNGLSEIISILGKIDWNAKEIMVFRTGQSTEHKPQDKVELFFSEEEGRTGAEVLEGEVLSLSLGNGRTENVRVHAIRSHTQEKIRKNNLLENDKCEEYIFLTNRLIMAVFGRAWMDGKERESGISGRPIILYDYEKTEYPIGLPAADKISDVMLSDMLYESVKQDSGLYDFVVCNRYSDVRMYIDFEKAEYGDKGRIKQEKIMIPRYYKILLGYLSYPLPCIRGEEYRNLLSVMENEKIGIFETCYGRVHEEHLYYLKENISEKQIEELSNLQREMKLLDQVELLRIPKGIQEKQNWKKKIQYWATRRRESILKLFVDFSESMLRATWTAETDDKNYVARLSPNLMIVLGVSDNDKIIVCFGREKISLRVLTGVSIEDYCVGIPAPARKKLGMNSVNDVVRVRRDMWHTLKRHSVQQGITFLGTILTVVQFVKGWEGRILWSLVTFLCMMYWILSEERVKVR